MVEYPGFTMSNSPSKIKMFLWRFAHNSLAVRIKMKRRIEVEELLTCVFYAITQMRMVQAGKIK